GGSRHGTRPKARPGSPRAAHRARSRRSLLRWVSCRSFGPPESACREWFYHKPIRSPPPQPSPVITGGGRDPRQREGGGGRSASGGIHQDQLGILDRAHPHHPPLVDGSAATIVERDAVDLDRALGRHEVA